MAHYIEFNQLRSSYSFFTVEKPAWHNLGKVVSKAVTSAEAIKLANLDFIVTDRDVYFRDKDGKQREIPNTKVIVREDTETPLTDNGILVTDKYKILQNHEAFDFFDSIAGENKAIFETAGSLLNGKIVFITARLPKDIVIKGVDTITNYLLLTNRHDGKGSIKVKFTPIRVVCYNTLNAALKGDSINIVHKGNLSEKLDNAKRVLGLVDEQQEFVEHIYNKFADINFDFKDTSKYLAKVLLNKEEYIISNGEVLIDFEKITTNKLNNLRKIVSYLELGAGQNLGTAKNTLFGAYNAITGYLQNVKNYDKAENKFLSYESGTTRQILDKAFEVALEYV